MNDGPSKRRLPGGRLRSSLFVAVAVAALVLVALSYVRDVVPDDVEHAVGFIGWRSAFAVLSITLIVFAVERERMFRRLIRRLEEERELSEHLEEIDRLRGDTVAALTHELKTPLTSLLGYASLLRKRAAELSDVQRVEFTTVIEQQAERILGLIEELLRSSRLEKGAGMRRAPLDLGSISREVAKELSTAHDRQIDVDAPPGDLGLFGDPAALEHVIGNLLDNALKYSPQGSPVHVLVGEAPGEVQLSVTDEGPGIPEDDLPQIFERYQQAGDARGRGSVGLGLYIVRNLVRAHGGRVWAERREPTGMRFVVALPRRRDA